MWALAGCGRDCAAERPREPSPPPPTPAAPQPRGGTGLTFPLAPPSPSALAAVPVFTGLELARPVFLTFAPGRPGRLYVVEQAGRILAFDRRDDVRDHEVFLDISDRVRMRHDEEGLLGLAFHPRHAENRKIYVYYSASNPRRVVLSEMTVEPGGRHVEPASEDVLLEIEQPWGNHNGGMIAFGPDGYLYVGLGDGGAAGDPLDAAQDPTNLLGKILRLDVDSDEPGYRIPTDNPFVGRGRAGRPEIYAFGLRNPWRFSFDRQTGALWCGDVGQDEVEEIDLIHKGGNYGWRRNEGTRPFRSSDHDTDEPPVPPVVEYGRDQGESVTGGYVYRGTSMPAFRGAYLYGDYVTGTVWALHFDGKRVVSNDVVARVPSLASFGEDADGEIYALGLEGTIYRFQARSSDDAGRAFPTRLSETGLFEDTRTLAPSPSLVPYDVNTELWSDGAHKRRWLALPAGESIDFDAEQAWSFPTGTVTVKHFELQLEPARPDSRTRLETRVMVHERYGWAGYSYRWNEAQTDAELVTAPRYETYVVREDGRDSPRHWYFPSGSDCLRCHTPKYGEVLGIRTRQLNRIGPGGKNTLADWNERGMFRTDIGDPSRYPAHPAIDDARASVDARARAYLDVNCAICHHRGGPAPGSIDMRVQTALPDMNLVGVRSEEALGLPAERRLAPGHHASSSVWQRMRRRDRASMPPLATYVSDEAASEVIARWIDEMPS